MIQMTPVAPVGSNPLPATSEALQGRLAPQTGTSFELREGDRLVVTDPQGEQVSDLICFAKDDKREWLSSGRSLDYANTIFLTKGHDLYSNRSRKMLTILEDTVGRHDFLLTPCSDETFQIIYKNFDPHPSCFGNLCKHLAKFGIEPDEIPTTFNIFMNVEMNPKGELKVSPPTSQAGDYIVFEAKMDLVVGLTACSAEQSNNYSFKPIDYRIIPREMITADTCNSVGTSS